MAQQPDLAPDSAVSRLKAHIRSWSPELLARRAAYEVALAHVNAAGRAGPAVIDADVEEVPTLNFQDAGSVRVSVSREFMPRPERRAARRVAERDVERAQLDIDISTRLVDATIDKLLVEASGSHLVLERLSAEDSLLLSVDGSLRSRFAVGDARYVDVLRLRTERLRVEVELQHSRADYRLARGQLLRLASVKSIDEPRIVPSNLRGSESETSSLTLVTLAIAEMTRTMRHALVPEAPSADSLFANSARLRLTNLAVDRAEASRALALAAQRPAISTSVGIQRFAREAGGYSIGPAIGASLSLPFTARTAHQTQRTLADREILLARAQRSLAGAEVASDVAIAHERYEAARSIFASFDEALLRSSRDEREAALASYRNGSLTLLELLDFERALSQAEVSRIRSRIEAAHAFVDLSTAATRGDDHARGIASMDRPLARDRR